MTWAIQRHTRGGRGWWPKRVLWVRDEKEHFALESNVFVVIPGLPTVLHHDSFPSIHGNQRCFGSLPLSLLSLEKRNCKIRKDFVDRRCRFEGGLTLCWQYLLRMEQHLPKYRLYLSFWPRLKDIDTNERYAPSGYFFFQKPHSLLKQPLDNDRKTPQQQCYKYNKLAKVISSWPKRQRVWQDFSDRAQSRDALTVICRVKDNFAQSVEHMICHLTTDPWFQAVLMWSVLKI